MHSRHCTNHRNNDVQQHDTQIDIAYLAGPTPAADGGEVVVHLSATHGVEGYAGSAVQIRMLRLWAQDPSRVPKDKHVVIVHAVNPYGMAHFRRWNENNVDLNRNGVHDPAEFAKLRSRDKNIGGYFDFDDLFNPTTAPTAWSPYTNLFSAARCIVTHGMTKMKRAMVSAQYHKPEGIFFGGFEVQPSHLIVKEYLEGIGAAAATGRVTVIDVHTGLGPTGVDTLLVGGADEAAETLRRFPVDAKVSPHTTIQALDGSGGASADSSNAAAGYELTRGTTVEAMRSVFAKTKPLTVTQEFGTVTGVLVGRAMILENQGFHHDPKNRDHWATYTRDAFYVRTNDWRRDIEARGVELFRQALV